MIARQNERKEGRKREQQEQKDLRIKGTKNETQQESKKQRNNMKGRKKTRKKYAYKERTKG